MTFAEQCIVVMALVPVMASGVPIGQAMSPATTEPSFQVQSPQPPSSLPSGTVLRQDQPRSSFSLDPEVSPTSQALFDFKDSDIKFKLETLMNILRDNRHESWVLSAYPDPKTGRPLIGAGFGLDVKVTDHAQRDPLNPHPFIEPSTLRLWMEAGLDPRKLQNILEQFERDLEAWNTKDFRRRVSAHQLLPELTEEEATKLLRISVIQAVHNARAYCRGFDGLTSWQQMALSQLVFQMGVNLEEFVHFLNAINDPPIYTDSAQLRSRVAREKEYWKSVQGTLIQSDWARRYTDRAVAVIAMFDPDYDKDPWRAERQVRARIRPLVKHPRRKPHVKSVRTTRSIGHIDEMPS